MTRRSSEIDATREKVFIRDHWRCQVCGGGATQCAHILPQDKLHLARFGVEVIHHPENMRAVCGLRCNARVQINYRSRPVEADAHAARVRKAIEGEEV